MQKSAKNHTHTGVYIKSPNMAEFRKTGSKRTFAAAFFFLSDPSASRMRSRLSSPWLRDKRPFKYTKRRKCTVKSCADKPCRRHASSFSPACLRGNHQSTKHRVLGHNPRFPPLSVGRTEKVPKTLPRGFILKPLSQRSYNKHSAGV
jgi:hypothetical protein